MKTFCNEFYDRRGHWIFITNINTQFIFIAMIRCIRWGSDLRSPSKNIVLRTEIRSQKEIRDRPLTHLIENIQVDRVVFVTFEILELFPQSSSAAQHSSSWLVGCLLDGLRFFFTGVMLLCCNSKYFYRGMTSRAKLNEPAKLLLLVSYPLPPHPFLPFLITLSFPSYLPQYSGCIISERSNH
jgi:hypothetical protein